ncbi:MAG: carbohydrate binding family 9 domain-containing protein [Crocinitomicaceae bacterium]|nr:carbohydrate binding family 9 domain-containing protein [Crocinitomicaceae bacterium]
MKKIWLFHILFLAHFALAQEAIERKEMGITRINAEVDVDGVLDEEFWKDLEVANDFIQNTPVAGAPSIGKTEVKIAYDDGAIYVGATMYEQPDSMTLTLSQRDDLGNADWFGVIIDPYNAGTIGFTFMVTSAGVQVDELHNVENVDENWNAVWWSAVQVNNDSWVAELKIPFAAIRFSKEATNDWGINFARNIRRNREISNWNFFDPAGLNLISQLGTLKGIKDVDSPLRLALTPYVSGYIENYDGTNSYSGNGGADIKWGVNEAFTLDMTLIPDFGQVQFDNQVLNTSPFEVYFNERRQFFTEGTELFNKPGSIFYSRRIGGAPVNASAVYGDLDSTEIVESNPATSQLLNATKLSGRTKKGTGIGIFNGVTGRMTATVLDTVTGADREVQTGPLSNYNVFVIDQNLKNNSSVALTNTNVWREGETYDANVTSFVIDTYTKGQTFNFWGIGNLSQKFFEGNTDLGHMYWVGAEKSAGNLQGGINYNEIGENYDPNDLGFNTQTNLRNTNAFVRYNTYKPFWRIFRTWSSLTLNYQRFINPDDFFNFQISASSGANFRNFTSGGFDLEIVPVRPKDYFEPRTPGRFYLGDAMTFTGAWISTDYSKPFALDVRGGCLHYFEDGRDGFDLNISPRIRFNDKWFLVYRYNQNNEYNEEGVALTTDFRVPYIGDDPIFAKRDRTTITNTIDLSYIFNNTMGITFRLRHYWSKLDYNSFYVLNEDGIMDPSEYTGLDIDGQSLHDNSYDAFTIDMVYRWIFLPGSEMTLVWKNSIFSFTQEVENNYFENLGVLASGPATNSLSIKILYYIDYFMIQERARKKRRI